MRTSFIKNFLKEELESLERRAQKLGHDYILGQIVSTLVNLL
jgi:hypothetical protein